MGKKKREKNSKQKLNKIDIKTTMMNSGGAESSKWNKRKTL